MPGSLRKELVANVVLKFQADPVLSKRGQQQYELMAPFMLRYLDMLKDGYDEETNPNVSHKTSYSSVLTHSKGLDKSRTPMSLFLTQKLTVFMRERLRTVSCIGGLSISMRIHSSWHPR